MERPKLLGHASDATLLDTEIECISCGGSECKELLASSGWREVVQARDDPASRPAAPLAAPTKEQPTASHTAAARVSSYQTAARNQRDAQLQSVSGKIASARNNSFTLDISENAPSGNQLLQGRSHASAMTFLIDENTAMDGKLKVGANAEVTYREQDGNNVAVSVQLKS